LKRTLPSPVRFHARCVRALLFVRALHGIHPWD
jgi:hypothetical protein